MPSPQECRGAYSIRGAADEEEEEEDAILSPVRPRQGPQKSEFRCKRKFRSLRARDKAPRMMHAAPLRDAHNQRAG